MRAIGRNADGVRVMNGSPAFTPTPLALAAQRRNVSLGSCLGSANVAIIAPRDEPYGKTSHHITANIFKEPR